MHRNPVILQISDLHFGRHIWKLCKPSINEDAKTALRRAVLRIEPRPDFLVVTGDLANRGKPEEMVEAKEYLTSILDSLRQEGQTARCIVVPGNHDVWRTTWAGPRGYIGRSDRLEEWNEVFDIWSFLSARVQQGEAEYLRPISLLDYYLEHGEPTGGSALNPDHARRLATNAQRVCEYFPAFRLAFLKLNSNVRLKRWKPAHIARGTVGRGQRDSVDEILRHYDRATQHDPVPFADARRIALVHHHVTRLPNVKHEKWMLMDDAGEVARWLARHGVRLVLHGHNHRSDVVGLTYWNTDFNHSKVETIVISAGSATALDPDDRHNSFHYIDLGHFRTRVWRPLLDDGEYQNLDAAAPFEFVHKPHLKIEDSATTRIPVFLEALQVSLAGEEKYADHKHAYASIKSTGYINFNRDYFGSIELEGKNDTNHATRDIPFVFTAVGAQYFGECDCQVWDLKTGQKLPDPELMEDRPIYVFPIRIDFAHPLAPQEDFRIRVHFRLKMVMLDENDYDMLSLLRFPRGIGHLTMHLLSERTIIAPSLWELRGDRLRESTIAPRPAEAVPTNPAGKCLIRGYGVDIDSPSALSYLLYYRKLE